MIHHRLKVGIGAVGIAVAVALVPVGPAWASSHKTHHKSKSKTNTASAATCPSAGTLGAAAGTTYTGPTTQAGFEKGWVVCQYNSQGQIALLVSLYKKGDSLKSISSNVPAATTKISGLGNAAAHYGTEVYVQRDSAPSFSVIDQLGELTLSQTEAEAKAIVAG